MPQAEYSGDGEKPVLRHFKPVGPSDLARLLQQHDPAYATELNGRLREQEERIVAFKPVKPWFDQGMGVAEDNPRGEGGLVGGGAGVDSRLAGFVDKYPRNLVFTIDSLVQVPADKGGEGDLALRVARPDEGDTLVVLRKDRTNPAALVRLVEAFKRGTRVSMGVEWEFTFDKDKTRLLGAEVKRLSVTTAEYSSVRQKTVSDGSQLIEPFKVREDGRILQIGLPYEGGAKLKDRGVVGGVQLSPRYVDKRTWQEVRYSGEMDEELRKMLRKEVPGGEVDNFYAVREKETTLFDKHERPAGPIVSSERIVRFKTF